MAGDRVEIIFDKNISPSINDSERNKRDGQVNTSDVFVITGGEQKRRSRPTDFIKAIRNDNFKCALINFYVQYWAAYKPNDTCYKYRNEDEYVIEDAH